MSRRPVPLKDKKIKTSVYIKKSYVEYLKANDINISQLFNELLKKIIK